MGNILPLLLPLCMLLDDGALLHLEDPLGAEDEQREREERHPVCPSIASVYLSIWQK